MSVTMNPQEALNIICEFIRRHAEKDKVEELEWRELEEAIRVARIFMGLA